MAVGKGSCNLQAGQQFLAHQDVVLSDFSPGKGRGQGPHREETQ